MSRGSSSISIAPEEEVVNHKSLDVNSKASIEPKIQLNNGSQLDSRLTKAVPMQTNTIQQITGPSSQQQAQPSTSQTQSLPSVISRLNLLNAGKAVPFSEYTRTHQDFTVKANNNSATTPFGPLCKITCLSARIRNQQLWESYVGSQVVHFSLCAKYVLICSIDGNIRFLDIKNGVLVLPILKLITPAIQSVFVSMN